MSGVPISSVVSNIYSVIGEHFADFSKSEAARNKYPFLPKTVLLSVVFKLQETFFQKGFFLSKL